MVWSVISGHVGHGSTMQGYKQKYRKKWRKHNLTPAFVDGPINLQEFGDIFYIMQIVVIESEGAKRTHFWLKVGYKD
jgi:hypothetical protein